MFLHLNKVRAVNSIGNEIKKANFEPVFAGFFLHRLNSSDSLVYVRAPLKLGEEHD